MTGNVVTGSSSSVRPLGSFQLYAPAGRNPSASRPNSCARSFRSASLRCVVQVAPLTPNLEKLTAPRVSRAAESDGAASRGRQNRSLGARDLVLYPGTIVSRHPRVMLEGMIPELVTMLHQRLQHRSMLRDGGVGAHDEECDLQLFLLEKIQQVGNKGREVRRPELPPVVTVGLQIRPHVVEIHRNARETRRARHAADTAARCSPAADRAPG